MHQDESQAGRSERWNREEDTQKKSRMENKRCRRKGMYRKPGEKERQDMMGCSKRLGHGEERTGGAGWGNLTW